MCIYTINYNYIYIHYIYIHYIYTYCNCINIIIDDIVHDLLYERVHTEKTYNYLGVQEDLQLNWGNYRDVKRGILP